MSFNHSENKLVTCPYDEAHKLKASRLQLHIAKCKLNHLDQVKEKCPFNATHLYTCSERDFHLMNCPDRAPLDRHVSQNALNKNNPFKGRTAVPGFSDPLEANEESWDDDADSYVPRAPPPGAIVEPQPMAKPAERRQLYKHLHREPEEAESEKTAAASSKPSSSTPRQPKQPSETQKFQNIQNLGLGRGRSRIAANIFDNVNDATRTETPTYSNIVKDMSNLGLGRGQPANQGPTVPLFKDDEDFPALGCGRGALLVPKQSPRVPGVKPLK